MSGRRLETIGLALILILLGFTLAEALESSTAPVRASNAHAVACICANTGTTNINNVLLRMRFRNQTGAGGTDITLDCSTLVPGETCALDFGSTTDAHVVFCEVTYPVGKLRVTLCNVTLGLCSDGR